MRPAIGPARARARGFTLIELMLALAIVVLLAGVAVVGLGPVRRKNQFREGVDRFATMLRMCRAESANLGKRLQVVFDDQTGEPSVQWEHDPLGSPGEFVAYAGGAWQGFVPTGLVRVESCQLTGDSANRWSEATATDQTQASDLQPVRFYPDGSCDSAKFVLDPVDADDTDKAVVQLFGTTGKVTEQFFTQEEWEQYTQDNGSTTGTTQ